MTAKITKIGITNDKISGRGGLLFILRYIEKTALYSLVSDVILKKIKVNHKGLQLQQFLKQIFACFFDGTDMSMTGFDAKKNDQGYAAVLENKSFEMASSHQMKRFFAKLSIVPNKLYREILHQLFIWRLRIEKPRIIILGIDTMVMDNDSARKREGCETTYKKKKGFQPLHICWGPYLIDVTFRKGSAHSNHGTDYIDCVGNLEVCGVWQQAKFMETVQALYLHKTPHGSKRPVYTGYRKTGFDHLHQYWHESGS